MDNKNGGPKKRSSAVLLANSANSLALLFIGLTWCKDASEGAVAMCAIAFGMSFFDLTLLIILAAMKNRNYVYGAVWMIVMLVAGTISAYYLLAHIKH